MSAGIIIVILCMFAVYLYGFRSGEKNKPIRIPALYAAFVLTRGLPLLAGDKTNSANITSVLLEMVLFVFLVQWDRKREGEQRGAVPFLYAFSPLTISLSLSASPLSHLLLVAVVAAPCFFLSSSLPVRERIGGAFFKAYPAYILFTLGCGLASLAVSCGQKLHWVSGSEEDSSVLLILAITLAASALVWGILILCGRIRRPESLVRRTFAGNASAPGSRLRIRPLVLILLLALVAGCAALTFFRIGNDVFPQTYRTLDKSAGTNSLTLELDGVQLSDIRFCIGRKPVLLTLVSYTDETSDANVFVSEQNCNICYLWTNADALPEETVSRLEITSDSDAAQIFEIVLRDEAGNLVLPRNADAFPELFDEQDLFDPARTYYNNVMFDETYYARAGQEIIEHDTLYETSHPPLGKNLFALSVYCFGNNPFGWRFVPAMCGILSVFFIFGLALVLTGSDWIALCAAALHCTEFMHLTLSRICTIDIVVALFILVMYFFMACFSRCFRRCGQGYGWLIPCGISTGLAVATKWTGAYAALGIAVMFFYTLFVRWGHIRSWPVKKAVRLGILCVVCFVLIPAVIYTASYFTYAWAETENRGILEIVTSSAKLMFDYHKDCVFYHPYSSEWYTWPLDIQPLIDAIARLDDGRLMVVATFGNPLICLLGIPAFLICALMAFADKDREASLLLIMYGAMLVPWWFIRRTVFIYQYYVCIQILCVMILYCMARMKEERVRKRAAATVLIASALLFLWFSPVLAGFPASEAYIRQLQLLPDRWRFF